MLNKYILVRFLISFYICQNAGVVTTHGFKCEVCDVTCTSAENLNTHVKGKKHLRIVRAAEDMAKKDEGVELEKEEAVEKTDGVLGEEENDDSEENCVVYSEGGVVNGKTCLVCAAYCRPKVVSCCKSCYNNFLTSFRV